MFNPACSFVMISLRGPSFPIIVMIMIIPTAPRIPPHHPSQREERRGVMSLVGQLLKSLSCLVAKLFSVLGCSLVE